MFDTNVFNRVLDGVVPVGSLAGRAVAFATHVQRDEINNTRDPARRAALSEVFREIIAETISTDSFVLGASRLDEARLRHIGYAIGGMMVFSAERVGRKMTINGARGFHPHIKDRFDTPLNAFAGTTRGSVVL